MIGPACCGGSESPAARLAAYWNRELVSDIPLWLETAG
jgi:hypothetical protein